MIGGSVCETAISDVAALEALSGVGCLELLSSAGRLSELSSQIVNGSVES